MNDDKVLNQLIDLIVSKSGKSRSKIGRKTRLSEDLGIDGDDAHELLEDFTKKFKVDLTGFIFDNYFAPEGFDPFRLLFYIIGLKKYKSLTVGDLEEAILRGKWS